MSGYIVDEAQESEGEEEEYNEIEKRKLKKLRKVQSDSSEDEEDEDDEEKLAAENKGFINDDDDEDEGGSDSDVDGKRKREEDSDLDEDNLDDDDLDLIEENIGRKINRKKKFKRLKHIEDEDSDVEEKDARTQIHDEIFQHSADEDEQDRESPVKPAEPEKYGSDEENEDEESDGEGSFIVDDDGQPIKKDKKKSIYKDDSLQAANDIFGVEFDYDHFEKYNDYDERDSEAEDDDYEDDEEDGEHETSKRIPKERRRTKKMRTIYDVYEPSELERGHLTSVDHDIRKKDIPERFQLRQIPVTPTRTDGGEDRAADKELEEESKWIYKNAFCKPYISNQEGRAEARGRQPRDTKITEKIFNALDLMRNSSCEVPFIAFFRKEEVQPELNIHDLWKIYYADERWCQLENRKKPFKELYSRMGEYQGAISMETDTLPPGMRIIENEDIDGVVEVDSTEQFNDYYKHFLLYYDKYLADMRNHFKSQTKQRKTKFIKVMKKVMRKKMKKKANIDDDDEEDQDKSKENGEEEAELDEEEEVETEVEEEVDATDDEEEQEVLKKAVRRHEYELLRKCSLDEFVRQFGLTPKQFGENLRDSYQRWDVEQVHEDPLLEAKNFESKICSTPQRVLEASVRIVGWQLACEPLVRNTIRELYFERAKISVRPTPQGIKMIDEAHNLYSIKYLKDKPVVDLQGDLFLKLKSGIEEKLITFSLSDSFKGNNSSSLNYLEEMKALYLRDEFSQVVQDWNDLRGRAVEFAYKTIIADLKKELTQRLLQEAKDHVLEMCCRKLYHWLSTAPYEPGDFSMEDEDEWDLSKGMRVFSIAFSDDEDEAAFGCLIDGDGDCAEYIRLPDIKKSKKSYNQRDVDLKENDMERVKEFIRRKKPHACVVSGECRNASSIVEDLKDIINQLVDDEDFPKLNVEIVDNAIATIYSVSKKGIADYLDYPPLLRQAISLGRFIKDPLTEISQLCNSDDEILNLKFHPLQDQLSPAELLAALQKEFVNRTNEVGVDLNNAVAFPHTQNLVQFVCGLGPRKAHALVKAMKQSNSRLENRNLLVVNYHMGPKVFINCAGFIKIDTNKLGDSDNYIEVLDSTRIHPEAYDWARKMAVDALEYDDEEGKPAEALEEILDTPEKLNELDLEAFAVELNNQGFGKKNITLYDIRHELNHRYKDFRQEYKPPSAEEVFNMLTKETPETFYIGKLLQIRITDFIHRKPRGEQLDQANPVRNEDSGLWQCPFCLKNDFPELSEVWNHFDAEDCPGQAVGVKGRLDNGISGFIHIKNLSDKTVTNPAERVKRQKLIYCRISKIDPEKFSVELTSKTSDLQDVDQKWRPAKDPFYDFASEKKDHSQENKKKDKKKTTYQRRVIAHPSFKNIEYNEAEKTMQMMEQGDAIIRPSSKGNDHLTVTWKVTNSDICQHIDVREQDKKNDFSLGKKLWIASEEFEDLDEILARHVHPLAANVRQILDYKYYKENLMNNKDRIGDYLKEDKKKNPKNIPYLFTCSKILPGKFMISYLPPRVKVLHEFVTVTPEGFKFRNKFHTSLGNLLKWFKLNFRNNVTATPGRSTNRTPYMGGATPLGDSGAMHKVGPNMIPTTPHFGTPYSTNYAATTPYTPSGQTPFMTPYGTPGPSLTPHHHHAPLTPRPAMALTPRYATGGVAPPVQVPVNPEMDWQKAAAAWAQQAAGGRRTGGIRTPRQQERANVGGDQTPLYDE